ncbi:hypothetical protein [Sandarakinorhabdus sp. DWP1-3-1]|uniref:hypothetical protein n=1 Tax=Sandarakinorhabdus sp. DWP1-3-1 TaxID=2804627 RepID=UPI003CED7EAA
MKWIEANHLEQWGRTTASEADLPALVADLICATIGGIKSIRFPSRGKGRVRGFDGVLESYEESLFVPIGKSVWELKSSANYKDKALEDFNKRTKETSVGEQADLTLVLVTPFTWDSSDRNKTLEAWVAEKKEAASWKDVVVIDGAMLEHWLDLAPAVAALWARGVIRGFSVNGIQSTEEYWREFAGRYDPKIIEELLTTERGAVVETVVNTMIGPPAKITIVADAPEFATAFAVAAIRSAPEETRQFIEARTLIVDTIEAGREMVGLKNMAFILRKAAARSPTSFAEQGPTVVPLSRWHRNDGGLPLPHQTSFSVKQVLLKIGLTEGRAETFARGCGGSLSALARMMGSGTYDPPAWEANMELLLPAFLAGSWDASNPLDQDILASLAGTPTYMAYEAQLRRFLNIEDAPLVVEANLFKVVAPIDAFVFAGRLIGEDHLDALRPLLLSVFGKLDPDPDPDKPYRSRPTDRHSDELRDGLATTLLLIAAWQKQAALSLAPGRGQVFADEVVRALPGLNSDYRVMASLKDELPLLAEAAPNSFLAALERMLEGSGAAIRPIFDEIESFSFPIPRHTGMLWALETLAWDPNWFRRACLILAGLATIDRGGRSANRPAHSLVDILLSWMPCTYASPELRLAVLDEIISDYPQVGWELVLKLLPDATTSTSGTSRPRLRGADFSPQPTLTHGDVWAAQRAASERALTLGSGDANRMGALLGSMLHFAAPERELGLDVLDYTLGSLDKPEREELWQALQDQIMRHKRFASTNWALDGEELAKLEAIANKHSPTDPVLLTSELFTFWGDDDDPDGLMRKRVEAVASLAAENGTEAIRALLHRSQQPHYVREAIEEANLGPMFLEQLLRAEVAEAPDGMHAGAYFSMFRRAGGALAALAVAADLLRTNTPATVAKLMRSWPTEPATWQAAASLGSEVLENYWTDLTPFHVKGDRRVLLTVIIQLMRRNRSIVALETCLNRIDEVPACLVLRMIDAIVGELNEGQKPRLSGLLDYELEETFKSLDKRNLPDMAIAQREYVLLALLERGQRPLKIHSLMARDPEMFHQILREIYRAENTEVTGVEQTDEQRARWRQAYKLLSHFSTVPGFTEAYPDQEVLNAWLAAMRALGVLHDRKDVTDIVVGNVLAHSPADDIDSIWPHRFVRDVLESSAGMIPRGIMTERVNMRGVTVRGVLDGGDQERNLAEQYRKDAAAIQKWPKSSAMLLAMAKRWDAYAEHEDIDARQRRLRS